MGLYVGELSNLQSGKLVNLTFFCTIDKVSPKADGGLASVNIFCNDDLDDCFLEVLGLLRKDVFRFLDIDNLQYNLRNNLNQKITLKLFLINGKNEVTCIPCQAPSL